MNNNPDSIEMPRFQCHKKVWALKIANVELREDGADVYPDEAGYAPFEVGLDWVGRFKPTNGECGYYVVYDDGYASWSPSKAFEDGYTRILSSIIPAAKPAMGVDEVTEDEIRSRAKEIIRRNGWLEQKAPPQLISTLELMVALGLDVLKSRPASCGYPDCGCDFDAVCNAALSGGTATPTTAIEALNDAAIDGWRPIVQRPTDTSEGWLKLADGSTFWGRWNRDHWERRTDALAMTTPAPEPIGGVEREGVEYSLNVFERLPNHVYPVAWREAGTATPKPEGAE